MPECLILPKNFRLCIWYRTKHTLKVQVFWYNSIIYLHSTTGRYSENINIKYCQYAREQKGQKIGTYNSPKQNTKTTRAIMQACNKFNIKYLNSILNSKYFNQSLTVTGHDLSKTNSLLFATSQFHYCHRLVGWLTSPFSTKIGHIGIRSLVENSAMLRMASNTVTSRPCCLFVQRPPKMGKDRGGSFKLLC